MNAQFFRRLGAAALTTLTVAGCAVEGPTPPDLSGREVRFTLLHTADWHSRLFPYNQTVSVTDQSLGLQQAKAPFGGAARMNWLIQRERAHADRLLHLDSGDCFQGAPIFNFFSGEAEVRALAHTGVDGVVIGNHEFDRGAANFVQQFSRWATFPVLAANYQTEDPTTPGTAGLATLARPYHIYDVRGLKVGVIGLGNLSSITSIFDQPNRAGITPLNTVEVTQFYIDMLRAQHCDLIVGVSHLGLDDDIRTINRTSGLDVMLGGHLHIVLNPSQVAIDCLAEDADGNHFIPELACDPAHMEGCVPTACSSANGDCCDASGVCPPEGVGAGRAWRLRPGFRARACHPRPVVLQHSGAFMKYLGRLDLVLTDNPERITQTQIGDAAVGEYDPIDRFEVVGHRFTLFPVDSSVPEEPTMARLLEPYAVALNRVANLDTLIGYSPNGVSRTNTNGGDSPMGNLVTTSMQRRLGVQTDFALTNTLGIRDAIPTGPVTVDQVFNVFPFDNSITTVQLSGREVLELFDFVARRSSGRGCNSQAQISGARTIIQCNACDRDGRPGHDVGTDGVELTACAATVNIGLREDAQACQNDADCNPDPSVPPIQQSLCEPNAHVCMAPLQLNGSYSLAANDYIAAGGSGFFVLQRNTTQVNTYVQLRDALVDFVQNGNPCGYNPAVAAAYHQNHPGQAEHGDDGLVECTTDAECGDSAVYACSCQGRYSWNEQMHMCSGTLENEMGTTCESGTGRCVLRQCRDDVANLVAQRCPTAPVPGDPDAEARCRCAAANRGGESCRILACFDESVGAFADSRLHMETVQ